MIPRIIHQIWIGDKPIPYDYINSVKNMNYDCEHILWTEEEFKNRDMKFECQSQIDLFDEICGKVDIMRIEILNRFGGIYVDADTLAIEPFDDNLFSNKAFAGLENEKTRGGLIGNSVMGFSKNHIILHDMISYIIETFKNKSDFNKPAWQLTGPILLTNTINKYRDTIKILPDYKFYPIHHCGEIYEAHGKIYSCQLWNSTIESIVVNNIYKIMQKPYISVSILIQIDKFNKEYLIDCFESIINQIGKIFLEIVIINNLKDDKLNIMLDDLVKIYSNNTSNCKWLIYECNNNDIIENIKKCSYEFIINHNPYDIMLPNKIKTQIDFMINHPYAQICGSQHIEFLSENKKKISESNYKTNIWEIEKNIENIINFNLSIFRKKAMINLYQNKDKTDTKDIIISLFEKYRIIYNIPHVLLYLRNIKNR